MFRKITSLTTAKLFGYAFISSFVLSLIVLTFLGKSAFDIQLHDTMIIIAYFHVPIVLGVWFAILGSVYYWFPKVFKKRMGEKMGKIHFYITVLGSICVFLPTYFLLSRPRQYYTYEDAGKLSSLDALQLFISFALLVLFLVQVLFAVNFFYSWFRGRKIN